jgi:hypothetical protein
MKSVLKKIGKERPTPTESAIIGEPVTPEIQKTPPRMSIEAIRRLEKMKNYLLKGERLTGPLESNEAQAQPSFISE